VCLERSRRKTDLLKHDRYRRVSAGATVELLTSIGEDDVRVRLPSNVEALRRLERFRRPEDTSLRTTIRRTTT